MKTIHASAGVTVAGKQAKPDYGKWRALSLGAVYLGMGLHIAHWKLAGRTLAPLEFNEVLYTIHLGIVTAGFIFMGVTMLATLVIGRFFCSWMCHMVALQDGSAWILNKMGIRPKHIRSRTLLWLPLGAVIYLFILPQIERMMTGQPAISFHIAQDSDGWASFLTNDFWRNLPGVGITLFTFFVCGGMVVYYLGSRSFCYFGCPYGVLFSLADRVAPGKILLTGDCTQCGKCTATCTSHIQVQREVNQFNQVVDPNCLKDLDCVQVCPEDALHFGFGKPSGFKSWKRLDGFKKRYDFSRKEDLFLATSTFLFIIIFRGLYDAVPFLLAIAIGILMASGLITLSRMYTTDFVRFGHFVLKRPHGIMNAGKIFSVVMLLLLVFSVHSAMVHYYSYRGEKEYLSLKPAEQTGMPMQPDPGKINHAFTQLQAADQLGLWHPASMQRELAALSLMKNDQRAAADYLARLVDQLPGDLEARLKYGKLLFLQGNESAAATQLQHVVESTPVGLHDKQMRAEAALTLGHIREKNGYPDEALQYYVNALADNPDNPEIKLALGVIYTRTGRLAQAEQYLVEASAVFRNSAVIENNLGVICLRQKRFDEAEKHLEAVNAMQPGNVQVLYNLAMIRWASGSREEGFQAMADLARLHPEHRNAQLAIAMMQEELSQGSSKKYALRQP